jgi:hypothetical protein
LYVKAQTPPTLGWAVFEGVSENIPVHVPRGTADVYKRTPGWDYFSNYIENE